MVLVETSVFTRQVAAALPDEAYRQLQAALAERPDLGARIPSGGGDLSAQRLRTLRRLIQEEYP